MIKKNRKWNWDEQNSTGRILKVRPESDDSKAMNMIENTHQRNIFIFQSSKKWWNAFENIF